MRAIRCMHFVHTPFSQTEETVCDRFVLNYEGFHFTIFRNDDKQQQQCKSNWSPSCSVGTLNQSIDHSHISPQQSNIVHLSAHFQHVVVSNTHTVSFHSIHLLSLFRWNAYTLASQRLIYAQRRIIKLKHHWRRAWKDFRNWKKKEWKRQSGEEGRKLSERSKVKLSRFKWILLGFVWFPLISNHSKMWQWSCNVSREFAGFNCCCCLCCCSV